MAVNKVTHYMIWFKETFLNVTPFHKKAAEHLCDMQANIIIVLLDLVFWAEIFKILGNKLRETNEPMGLFHYRSKNWCCWIGKGLRGLTSLFRWYGERASLLRNIKSQQSSWASQI